MKFELFWFLNVRFNSLRNTASLRVDLRQIVHSERRTFVLQGCGSWLLTTIAGVAGFLWLVQWLPADATSLLAYSFLNLADTLLLGFSTGAAPSSMSYLFYLGVDVWFKAFVWSEIHAGLFELDRFKNLNIFWRAAIFLLTTASTTGCLFRNQYDGSIIKFDAFLLFRILKLFDQLSSPCDVEQRSGLGMLLCGLLTAQFLQLQLLLVLDYSILIPASF